MYQYTSSPYSRRLMRSPDGMVFGVCRGIAKRLGVSTGLVRLITLVALVCTGFFPVGLIYILLALVLPVGPERVW